MRRVAFPFWLFSGRTYGKRGVERACLALQDECGADVNLLLYCCWMGRQGRQLDGRALRSAMAAVARWQHEVVWPLRRARRAIRKEPGGAAGAWAKALRRRIAAAELDAEYVEQRVLAKEAAGAPPSAGNDRPREAAASNLDRYLHELGAAIGPRQARFVQTLIAAA